MHTPLPPHTCARAAGAISAQYTARHPSRWADRNTTSHNRKEETMLTHEMACSGRSPPRTTETRTATHTNRLNSKSCAACASSTNWP